VGNLLLLAVASAVYPLLVAATVLMLATPKPPAILGAYLAGGALVSIGIGLAGVFALAGSGVVSSSHRSVSPAIDLVVGVLLLVLAVLAATGRVERRTGRRRAARPKKEKGPSWSQRTLRRGSPRLTFFVGMALSLPSLYYIVAIKDIAESYDNPATRVGLILAFNVIQFAIVEVPLVAFLVNPEATRRRVERGHRWMRDHRYAIAAVIAAVVGVYLLIKGIRGLA
jgi:hypothetical protein